MIRAIEFPDRVEFRARKQPGSIAFDLRSDPKGMWFCCPCGCGDFARIPIGKDVKPSVSPSWLWNGSRQNPELKPSVHQLNCGWHGWLRMGYWETC